MPVVLDIAQTDSDADETRFFLWWLLPVRIYWYDVVMNIHRPEFIRWIEELEQPIPPRFIAEHVAKWLEL